MTVKPLSFALAATLAMVAGCSGASTPTPNVPADASLTAYPLGVVAGTTAHQHSGFAPLARHVALAKVPKGTALLYVSDSPGEAIDVFKQGGKNQSPIGTITSLNRPAGITVDLQGNLYVANESKIGSSYNVDVFAPGATAPTKVYDTDLSSPTDVAVAKDGTVYVSNFNELSNGWVTVYPKGDASKEYRLSDFGGGAPLTLALDRKNDLYVMYDLNATGSSAVNEYRPGATTGTNLNLVFHWGGGIQVDAKGNIVLAQQLQPSEINVYPPGQTQPAQSIQLPNGDSPFEIALNHAGKALFAADDTLMDRIAYPSGNFKYTLAGGFEEAAGVAVSPAQYARR
ncbi:MAG TPA: hypothetical protein VGF86_16405 [Candidatus Tumulicola sp.]|jgi:sugar lactone lactonase YvrE